MLPSESHRKSELLCDGKREGQRDTAIDEMVIEMGELDIRGIRIPGKWEIDKLCEESREDQNRTATFPITFKISREKMKTSIAHGE